MGFIDWIKKRFGITQTKEIPTELEKETTTRKEELQQTTTEELIQKQPIKQQIITKEKDIHEAIKKLPEQKTFQKEIETSRINTYSFETLSQTTTKESKDIQQKYNKLLEDKIIDPQLQKEIIKNSDSLLRKRIVMQIQLLGAEGTSATFKVVGILPEDEAEIHEYFVGKTITSNKWNEALQEFKTTMNEKGKRIIAIRSITAPQGKITATNAIGEASLQ